MKTQLSSKRQIVLPADLREADHLVSGQVFEIQRLSAGEYLLKKARDPGQPGLVKWLSECPSSDWFQSLDSESTDSLKSKGRAMPIKDSLIAATARQFHLPVATRNAKDFAFAGVKVVNPFD